MDPLTHWALGTTGALSLSKKDVKKHHFSSVIFFASLGAVTPDLDSLIQSRQDPLLYIEFHRHFTHSLLMAPIYSLVLAMSAFMIFRLLKKTSISLMEMWRWTLLGMSTHGLLDTCTSYGTHLWWPLSNDRSAWNIISIIDPLFTIPLIFLIVLSVMKKNVQFVRYGAIFSILYLCIGFFQRQSILSTYASFLQSQQFAPVQRLDAKPSFANLWLWRGIAFDGHHYRVDSVFKLPFQQPIINIGQVVSALELEDALKIFDDQSRAKRDLERFRFFSDDYLYLHQIDGDIVSIGDLRYSLVPNSIEPLWVIQLDPNNQNGPTPYVTVRNVTEEKKQIFMRLLRGELLDSE